MMSMSFNATKSFAVGKTVSFQKSVKPMQIWPDTINRKMRLCTNRFLVPVLDPPFALIQLEITELCDRMIVICNIGHNISVITIICDERSVRALLDSVKYDPGFLWGRNSYWGRERFTMVAAVTRKKDLHVRRCGDSTKYILDFFRCIYWMKCFDSRDEHKRILGKWALIAKFSTLIELLEDDRHIFQLRLTQCWFWLMNLFLEKGKIFLHSCFRVFEFLSLYLLFHFIRSSR